MHLVSGDFKLGHFQKIAKETLSHYTLTELIGIVLQDPP